MPDMPMLLTAAVLLAPIVWLLRFAGCGLILDFDPPDPGPPPFIDPHSAALNAGDEVTFRVATNPPTNQRYDFDLDPAGADSGALRPGAEPASVIYTAPGRDAIGMGKTVALRVFLADADPATRPAVATASIQLLPYVPPVDEPLLNVTPDLVNLCPSETADFLAVTGPDSNARVNWTLRPAFQGTLLPRLVSGVRYTAPPELPLPWGDMPRFQTAVVVASATQAGAPVEGSAMVRLFPVWVSIDPPGAGPLRPGETALFTAQVNTDNPSSRPADRGGISWSASAPGGLYTAPASLEPGDSGEEIITASSIRWPAAPPGRARVRRTGTVLRINCGGDLLVDPLVKNWLADTSEGSSAFGGEHFRVEDHYPAGSSRRTRAFTPAPDPRFGPLAEPFLTCRYGGDFSYLFQGFYPDGAYRIRLTFLDVRTSGGQDTDLVVSDRSGARSAIRFVPIADFRTPVDPIDPPPPGGRVPRVREIIITPAMQPRPDGTFDLRFTAVDSVNAFALVNAIEIELV